MNLKIPLSG